MRGREVRFVTGTDEHGEKIAESAAAAGATPQEHCDAMAAKYEELWRLVRLPAWPCSQLHICTLPFVPLHV